MAAFAPASSAADTAASCRAGSDPARRGSDVYHPAGAFYGPQEVTTAALVLTAQFATADGSGFLTYDELRSGFETLSKEGEFRDGYFVGIDGGERRRVDGYQAVWERIYHQPMTYPTARYDAPILIQPGALPGARPTVRSPSKAKREPPSLPSAYRKSTR